MDAYLLELYDKPCKCVICITCNGQGRIYHECYDEPQDEACFDCDGSGLTEVCDRCMEIEQEEYRDRLAATAIATPSR